MKQYCTRCNTIHDKGACPAPRTKTGKTQDAFVKFRNTKAWINKRAAIQRRDMHCCRVCASMGVLNSEELSVHHIVPLAASWDARLDDDNLITLCVKHHRMADAGSIPKSQLKRLLLTPVDVSKLVRPRGSV